ncbi:MAG: SDR family NAD(P)-dependent oxidoreductase [Idiomarina sp.]|nr:SDR family NAD(P)-dependent oxidoreductase [Idiomarina sp.]
MTTIAVFGAGGGLGLALVQEVATADHVDTVWAVSRQAAPSDLPAKVTWWQIEEPSLPALQKLCADWQHNDVVLDGVISTIGWLHRDEWMPERRIEQLNDEQLAAYFYDNAVIPAMLLQSLKPLLPKKAPAFVAQLGAKVGSIGDNELGGWYGYRASKAALNMLFKTAAIEFRRTHKQLTLSVIHPGTTDTDLSEPFQERLPADKLFTPELSAQRIWQVIQSRTPNESGGFWFWDGTPLPW